jgi:serine/threonine-protein kinase
MGSFKLARRWSSTALSDAWLGTSVTGRPVVAHVRREPWSKSSGLAGRYAPFVRGWQGLRQPGVVPLIEVGLANGNAWVVEEFIEGESLRAVLTAAASAKTRLAPLEATAVVLQAARGLLALQRLLPPLTHGDVSAATTVVGVDGDVRLAVVGLASAHEADATLGPARAELFCIAPEETVAAAGSATDVFRLGLVWLEALTGRTVFSGATPAEVQARLEQYQGLGARHFPGFPAPIAQLLAAMLHLTPGERPSVGELESKLVEVFRGLGGTDDVTTPVARAFARLFPGRVPIFKGLEGTELLALMPLATTSPTTNPVAVGSINAEGAVTLAKMAPRRVTAGEMAATRAKEVADAARAAAAEWQAQHAGDDGNPKDFALGAILIEKQRISVAQADAALEQSHAFGSTFLYSLNFLGHLDEDEGLPFQAELLKQRCLTIAQLLELDVSQNAALLPRETAEQWLVVPLKLEAGGLTVAIADPGLFEVLDEVKRRAKVRSVSALRATERTLQEGLLRVYAGKTAPPEWLAPSKPQPTSREALDPSALPPLPDLEALDPSALPPLPDLEGFDLSLPPPPGLEPLPPPPGSLMASTPAPLASLPPLPEFNALPPMPGALSPARVPVSSPPLTRPLPTAPLTSPPVRAEGPSPLDVVSRLFDAVLSLVPERGLEAARLLVLVRAVAKQSGATGLPLEQVRLSAKALIVAALLEGKRGFEAPSLPAVMGVLASQFRELEPVLSPVIDGHDQVPADPRAMVLLACFSLCQRLGEVPTSLAQAEGPLSSMRSAYPAPAIAALEAVLSR